MDSNTFDEYKMVGNCQSTEEDESSTVISDSTTTNQVSSPASTVEKAPSAEFKVVGQRMYHVKTHTYGDNKECHSQFFREMQHVRLSAMDPKLQDFYVDKDITIRNLSDFEEKVCKIDELKNEPGSHRPGFVRLVVPRFMYIQTQKENVVPVEKWSDIVTIDPPQDMSKITGYFSDKMESLRGKRRIRLNDLDYRYPNIDIGNGFTPQDVNEVVSKVMEHIDSGRQLDAAITLEKVQNNSKASQDSATKNVDPVSVSMGLTYLDSMKSIEDQSNEDGEVVKKKCKLGEDQERVIRCNKAADQLMATSMDIMDNNDDIVYCSIQANMTMALYNYFAAVSERSHGEERVIANFNKRVTKHVMKSLDYVVWKNRGKPSPLINDDNGDQIKVLAKIVALNKKNRQNPYDSEDY